ncbi:MAG: ChaN family lipoprotein [Cyanobacteria bacterium J06643_4]
MNTLKASTLGLLFLILSVGLIQGTSLFKASQRNDAATAAPPLAQTAKTQTAKTQTAKETPAPESSNSEIDNTEALAAIAEAQVVYLGENHNSEADHAAQLEIIETMAAEQEIAIALEMFQRPYQDAVDGYLAGELTEAEFIEQSEYETRWGFDWELYAPILRYAKANQIPVIALNTPTEVTRQVATDGLESLTGDALTYIPPIDEIDTTDTDYRESISAVFSAHGGAGHSLSFENFFAAQVLWDETMAEGIVKQLEAEPTRQVIVLAGEGHIAYDYGIPNRVTRRLPDVNDVSVRLLAADQPSDPDFADFTWVTP